MKRIVISLLLLITSSILLTACGAKATIKYQLTGTAQEVVVRYVDEGGKTSSETTVPLPFDMDFKAGSPFKFQLYATNVSGKGDVKCEVFADDKSLGRASGTFFAGCEGSYEKKGNNVSTRFTSYSDVLPKSYDAPAVKLPGLSGILLFAGDQKSADSRNFYVFDFAHPGAPTQWSTGLGRSSSCPRLSPDGTKIAFVYGGSVQDLFVINVDGTGLTNLTNDGKEAVEDFCADWSPDGTRLIYTAATKIAANSFVHQVYAINMDGSNRVQLTSNTNDQASYQNPAFSPDGSKIAFLPDTLSIGILMMNADGSNLAPLEGIKEGTRNIRWSPDGARLVYACTAQKTGKEGVCVADSDGANATRITDDTVSRIYYTDWSPDGKKIIFIAKIGSTTNLYAMNPDGTDLFQVTHLQKMDPLWVSWYPSMTIPKTPVEISVNK